MQVRAGCGVWGGGCPGVYLTLAPSFVPGGCNVGSDCAWPSARTIRFLHTALNGYDLYPWRCQHGVSVELADMVIVYTDYTYRECTLIIDMVIVYTAITHMVILYTAYRHGGSVHMLQTWY